ncbi:MAG: hypothetical protein HUU20_10260 [Pirellulales bacterium]|nr:hypothetical protein [Pirellulales bacterium]
MNRWVRWLLFATVLAVGLAFLMPQNAEATWGRHCGCFGPRVSYHGGYYGGYYAPYRAYSPVAVPAHTYGCCTPYAARYYGYQPYARSFYYGPGMYWFGSYGW